MLCIEYQLMELNMSGKVTEYKDCLAFFKWTQLNQKLKGKVVKHVNEGKRTIIGGRLLKMIGLTKGLPDYQVLISNKNWHGLFIEMKTLEMKNRKLPLEQLDFIESLKESGYHGTIAYGWEHAVKIVKDYMDDKI